MLLSQAELALSHGLVIQAAVDLQSAGRIAPDHEVVARLAAAAIPEANRIRARKAFEQGRYLEDLGNREEARISYSEALFIERDNLAYRHRLLRH